MYNVCRVTAASVTKTQKGYDLFSVQLDKALWATKLAPLREIDKRWDSLFQRYVKNDKNLEFLVGRYIAVSLEDSKFGKNLGHIESFDVIGDFKKLLDDSKGKAFLTKVNVYDFLRVRGYAVNPDMTITLREPYSSFNIRIQGERTVCCPNDLDEGSLTLENIDLIYEKFFKGKFIDNGNDDRDEQYGMNPVAITMHRRSFHKTQSKVISSHTFDVLRVGDRLSEEHRQFLSGKPH